MNRDSYGGACPIDAACLPDNGRCTCVLQRDYLAEARRILAGETAMLPQIEHLKAIASGPVGRSLLFDVIRVLESCEAKLEYLGRTFSGPHFTDRHGDGPDCLHRAYKARDAIATLKRLTATPRSDS